MRTYLLLPFLTGLSVTAQAGQPFAGGMNMYVFPEQNQDASVAVPAPQALNAGGKALKMVIFNAEPTAAGGATPPKPVKVQPEPVVLDQYPRRSQPEDEVQVQTYLELGYRNDEMKWNKAAPSGSPNVLSELQWNNVHSGTITAGSQVRFDRHWQAEGKISYGQIAAGQNQDSDYDFNDRQGEFSRSNNASNDGMSVDLSGALGYSFTIGRQNRAPFWRITPKLGYAFHSQQFNMTKGNQTISDRSSRYPELNFPPVGSFDGLDSTYENTWFGPFSGMSSLIAFHDVFSLESNASLHWVDYEGTGHWNLRQDLRQPISFKHSADGVGLVLSSIARFRITPNWLLRLSVDYQYWLANEKGKDKMFFSDGSSAEMRLNEAKWQSYGLNLGFEYLF